MTTRKTLLQLLHIAKKDLAMPDDSYRAILQKIGGKPSAADLKDSDLEKVLAHLKKCGFKVKVKGSKRPLADDAQSSKIRALWLDLAQMEIVRNPSEDALAAFVKRMTKVDALQWLSSVQASAVIEHLKKWYSRVVEERVVHLIQAQGLQMIFSRDTANYIYECQCQMAAEVLGRPVWVNAMSESEYQRVLRYAQRSKKDAES